MERHNKPFAPEEQGNFQPWNAQYVIGESLRENLEAKSFFSERTLRTLSLKITQHLQGVHPDKKRIVVHDDVLRDLMRKVYVDYFGHSKDMMNIIIALATSYIRDEFEFSAINSKLNKNVIKYDESYGLVKYDPCTTRAVLEHPFSRLSFHMSY
jgi:hypothetical protein